MKAPSSLWLPHITTRCVLGESTPAPKAPKDSTSPIHLLTAHPQFLDPLLLASEVRRGSGRRVAFLIAEKSIKRKFIGAAAKLMQSSELVLSFEGKA